MNLPSQCLKRGLYLKAGSESIIILGVQKEGIRVLHSRGGKYSEETRPLSDLKDFKPHVARLLDEAAIAHHQSQITERYKQEETQKVIPPHKRSCIASVFGTDGWRECPCGICELKRIMADEAACGKMLRANYCEHNWPKGGDCPWCHGRL